METKAITYHLPQKDKQSIIFGIKIGVPVTVNGYPKENKNNLDTKALIDTGATGSSISIKFAQAAQLKTYKRNKIQGFNGIAIVPVYKVDVLLPSGILFKNLEVAEFQNNFNFDFIIGMDILCKGDMALTNAKEETVFSFRIPPSETHIDFTK